LVEFSRCVEATLMTEIRIDYPRDVSTERNYCRKLINVLRVN